MKKIIFGILALAMVVFLNFEACALDSASFFRMRTQLYNESQDLKALIANSPDAAVINGIWGTCLITISQLDAYVCMIGVFNSVKGKDSEAEAVNYLSTWLSGMKSTSDLNIKAITDIPFKVQPKTKVYLEKLKGYLVELNKMVDMEIGNVASLSKAMKMQTR